MAQEAATRRLEPQIAELCGMLNAGAARLVGLIAEVIETLAEEMDEEPRPQITAAVQAGGDR